MAVDPHHERLAAQLLRRAARERWNVPAKTLESAPAAMDKIINDEKSTRSKKISAARAVVAMVAANNRDVHHIEKLEQERGMVEIRQQRADEGKAEAVIGVQVLPTPAAAPVAAWMKRLGMSEPNEG